MASAILGFQHTTQNRSGGFHLAPEPASRTRPRRIRPSILPTFSPFPAERVPTGRPNALIYGLAKGQRATAGRASGEQPRFTSRCFQLLTTVIPGWAGEDFPVALGQGRQGGLTTGDTGCGIWSMS